MRVLIYSHSFAPQIGGVEAYTMLLARGLAARRASQAIQVVLVTNTLRGAFDDGALPFTIVRRPGLARLVSLIRRSDVVHLAGPALGPLFLAVLLRKPVVVEHHGYQANCPNGLLFYEPTKSDCPGHYMQHHYVECLRCNAGEAGWLTSLRWLALTGPRRWLCARANVNVCVTNHVGGRVSLPRSRVIYHGVAPVLGTPLATPPSASARRKALVFGYAGRFVSEKGLPVLLRACEVLKNAGVPFELRLIGDGPERNYLESLAQHLSIAGAVRFTGMLQGEAYEKELADVDVMVMPSVWEETAGLSAIEQMARGRAVVVSDLGGVAEIVGEAGLKSPPGDAAALARCLKRFVDEPGLLDTLGRLASKRAQEMFSLDRMVEEHGQLFEGLLT